ncbi:alpha/beta hydrolase family protein [Limimaricola hongkongensis]|uniref:Hydrolase, putative n=1 Tax=Limimaricola hongkongensis DSM 17492 TaxID=1122180 RepID=A0A017HE61_9RHOB|nr:alpha/beta fold hydrolase [Limimaricola hongkongensis]EYD72580.1 hydrolase, putative [Limimaricola hongkongensis DSM 17492]
MPSLRPALLIALLLAAAPGHAQRAGAAAPGEEPGAAPAIEIDAETEAAPDPASDPASGPEAGTGEEAGASDVDLSTLMVIAPWPRPLPLSDGRAGLSDRVSIEVDGTPVHGLLATPPGGPAPVVLLLHGFTGDRDELDIAGAGEGVFARTARLLAEAGYASLRIDFRGSGESTEGFDFARTTFDSQIADAQAALDWLAADARVLGRPYLIGWSQGGLVAASVAGRGAPVEAVALWAGVADPQITFATLFGPKMLEQGVLSPEPTSVTLPWGAEITLAQPFFEAILDADPLAEIARYDGPLFVAQGSEDATVDPAQAEMWLSAHDGPEELWLREMDHAFDAYQGPDRLDEMVAATVAFFDLLGAP